MTMEKATFAAGCFWGVEEAFSHLKGVSLTQVGYCGGSVKNPTYEQVCSGTTGHAESIEILFDPSEVSYDDLLNVFWTIHDPTTLNRQGPDVGSQYRSVIFYHHPEQEKQAFASKSRLQNRINKPIVTEIYESAPFYPAEDYHQKYHQKHGGGCGI